MNLRKWIILAVVILIAIAAVWWLGSDEHNDEIRAFLRGLRRVL